MQMMKAIYTDAKFIPDERSVEVWYALLKDLDINAVKLAVAKYMQTKKFPPFPADIREMLQAEYLSPDEAWAIVSDALWACTSKEKAEKIFSKLPLECQRTIGSAEAFYAYTQGEWNESVSKALFIKNYKPTVDRMQTESRVSIPLRTALASAERKAIGEKT